MNVHRDSSPRTSPVRWVGAVVLLLLSTLLVPAAAAQPASPAADPVDGSDLGAQVTFIEEVRGKPVIQTRVAEDRAAARSLVARLEARGYTAELDQPVQAFGHSGDDPLRGQQWYLDRLYGRGKVPSRHASRHLVAVIDTGVDATHPDLDGRVVRGKDFLTRGSRGMVDPSGHGTAVASVIGATTGNGVGIAATGPASRILPVRVLDERGAGSTSDVAKGIIYAVDEGAAVVNLSLGSTQPTTAVRKAVEYAERKDVVVVAATGNYGTTGKVYPAAEPSVVGVSATRRNDRRASFASHGRWISLTAPGVDVVAAHASSGRYGSYDGTSFSAPMAAGTAALVRQVSPGYRPEQVRARLTYTAEDLGPAGFDAQFGSGMLAPRHATRVSKGFPDTRGNTHETNIRSLVETRITNGCRGGSHYCPSDAVTRAEMASFIRRALQLGPVQRDQFVDIRGLSHRPNINAIARAGVTEGCGGGRYYCPHRSVTRAEMAAFIQRALDLEDARESFRDVPNGAWYAPAVGAISAAGITEGCGNARHYCPDRTVTRAEMASFLARGFGL